MRPLANPQKIGIMVVLLLFSCVLTFYFHVILGLHTVFTHLFYIPIILGALWWKRKGLVVAVILSVSIIAHHFYLSLHPENLDDYFRTLMFLAISFTVGVLREKITDKEKKLRESEGRYRLLFQNMTTGFALHEIIFNREGAPLNYRFLEVNPAFEQMTGVSAADIVGRTLRDNNLAINQQLILGYEAVKTTEKPFAFEYYSERRNRFYSVTAYSPEPGRFATIVQDITERKRAEADRERLISAIEQAGDTIVITDAKAKIQYANPAFEQMTGYTQAEAIGNTPQILRSGAHAPAFHKTLWDTILSGRRWSGRIINKRKGGECYTAESSVSPVRGESGEIVNYVWISRDISKNIELEKRLVQSQRIEAIGTLAGGIAHDFNNLLFPIIGISEILIEDIPPENPHHENVAQILKAAKRAGDLVRQILSFSGHTTLQKAPIRVQTILKEVLKLARSTIPSNIEISQNIHNDCAPVMADSTQLHQIAMNLITNAYHAVAETGGAIHVQLEAIVLTEKEGIGMSLEPGNYARISVSDTGHGIDPEVIDQIFEPFFTTKAQGKGTGLGLSVVYGIVKEHEGVIRVSSVPGKGASFQIYLPQLGDTATEEPSVDIADKYNRGAEKILLVDDEKSVAKLGKQILERLGYTVTAVTGSLDALDLFCADPSAFDLLITDMTMPNMTGDALASKLMAIKPGLPVILCTGFSEKTSEEQARAMGIKGYLLKPIMIGKLAAIVREVLDTSPSCQKSEPVS